MGDLRSAAVEGSRAGHAGSWGRWCLSQSSAKVLASSSPIGIQYASRDTVREPERLSSNGTITSEPHHPMALPCGRGLLSTVSPGCPCSC